MKNKLLKSSVLSLLFIVLSGCTYNSEKYINPDSKVKVSCVADDNVIIANPIQDVDKGANASFSLSFKEGYQFASSSYGEYSLESKTLFIENVVKPLTVCVSSKPNGGFVVIVENDDELGYVSITPSAVSYNLGDEVTIKTTPKNGNKFLCYSYEETYRKGMKAYGKTSGTAVSFDSEYKIIVNQDLKLVTNYFSTDPFAWNIDYDLNGGVTVSGNETISTDFVPLKKNNIYFPCTINGNYFTRSGYELIGYNTEKDGTGESIGIGSKVCVDYFEDRHITLYCQWKKWTHTNYFSYTVSDSGATLTSVDNFSQSSLVIPSVIDGYDVTTIAANAITDNDYITEIVIPLSVTTIEKSAIKNCKNLKEMYVTTNITSSFNDSIIECDNLTIINISKYCLATDFQAVGWYNMSTAWETIYNLEKQDKPLVIAVGHSTIKYNHDFTPLKEKYGDDYIFYKYVGTAGISESFLLYTLNPLLKASDYLIIPMFDSCIKTQPIQITEFKYLQYDFDIIKYANYQVCQPFFFESFALYNSSCVNSVFSKTISSEQGASYSGADEFGGGLADKKTDDPNNEGSYGDYNIYNSLKDELYDYLVDVFDSLKVDHDHLLLTWNPFNTNNIKSEYSKKSFLDYEILIRRKFSDCVFFDTIEENIMPGNYFNVNDMVHLSTIGGTARIQRWVEEIQLP